MVRYCGSGELKAKKAQLNAGPSQAIYFLYRAGVDDGVT